MYTPIGKHYYYDGLKKSLQDFETIAYDQKIIYEVIRVIKGEALFLDDHLSRMKKGLLNDQVSLIESIKKDVGKLVEAHSELNQNIKIDVFDVHYRLYFLESTYPAEILYQTGVEVKLASVERKNPNIKALDMTYKEHIEKIKGDAFEVILLNDNGEISEGSKSNFLFIKNDCIISAPLDKILVGVTYSNVLKMAVDLGYEITYRIIKKDEIHTMDACFLTGTSLGVLPIAKIDEVHYSSSEHIIVKSLRQAYEEKIRGTK